MKDVAHPVSTGVQFLADSWQLIVFALIVLAVLLLVWLCEMIKEGVACHRANKKPSFNIMNYNTPEGVPVESEHQG